MSDYPDVDTELAEIKDKAHEIARSIDLVEGIGTCDDGTITVITDSSGRVRGVDLKPEAARVPAALSASIIQAARRAEEDAARQVEEIARSITEDARIAAASKVVRDFALVEHPNRHAAPVSDEEMDTYYKNFSALQ